MTKFYQQTGYKEKLIKNKLWVTSGSVKEKESILIQNTYANLDNKIILTYFDTKVEFTDIRELVKAAEAGQNLLKQLNNTSN